MKYKHRPGARPGKLGVVALAAALLGAAGGTRAALTENLATSSTAMNLGNAVTADPPGIESIHFNPAGLARLKGDHWFLSGFGASIRIKGHLEQPDGYNIGGFRNDPLAGTSTGRMRQILYVPIWGDLLGEELPAAAAGSAGISFNKPGSRFTFATGFYPAMAVPYDRTKDADDPGRFDGKQVSIQRLVYAAPSVGYQLTDTLSIGLSVPIAHQAVFLTSDMRFPNPLIGILGQLQNAFCGEDGNPLDPLLLGICGGGKEGRLSPYTKAAAIRFNMTAPTDPTFNLGILWEPKDWFALGAVYQSGSNVVISGKYDIEVTPMLRRFLDGLNSSLLGPIVGALLGFPQSVPALQRGHLSAVLPFPPHVQLGLKLKPIAAVQVNLDASWADWGKWSALHFKFDQSIKVLEVARLFGIGEANQLTIPRGYRSVWHYGLGVQVRLHERVTLLLGYEPRKSSIPSNKLDLLAALPDLVGKSIGVKLKLSEKSTLQVGASYLAGRFNVPAGTSSNANATNLTNLVYNPYAGLDISGFTAARYIGLTFATEFD